jgi:hypothetical protein
MQRHKTDQLIESDLQADDIDILFSQLQTIEASPTLIAHILNQLPARSPGATLFIQPLLLRSLDNWASRDRKRKLC